MNLTSYLILLFLSISLRLLPQSPGSLDKIKVQKIKALDSAYFDFKEFAVYTKTSGFANRFKTIKQCNVEYVSRKKSGEFKIKNNYLPKTFKSTIVKLRTKK